MSYMYTENVKVELFIAGIWKTRAFTLELPPKCQALILSPDPES